MKVFITMLFFVVIPMSAGVISAAAGILVTDSTLLYLAINIPVFGISVLVGYLLLDRLS